MDRIEVAMGFSRLVQPGVGVAYGRVAAATPFVIGVAEWRQAVGVPATPDLIISRTYHYPSILYHE